MTDFARPRDGIKFDFLGMKTNASPDSIPPNKFAFASNIRQYSASSIRTRPGQVIRFGTLPGHTITDIGTYSGLSTDNLPRILARDSADGIFLDLGNLVGTLAGGGLFPGVSMIPFRPNASPNPWMYIANNTDYQKFSAPAANVVTAQKVGIAEPQSPPDVTLATSSVTPTLVTIAAAAWTAGGTAAASANGTRLSDTSGAVLLDPIAGSNLYSIQVASTVSYQRLMQLQIGNAHLLIQDVFPGTPTALNISSIYYFSGNTGRCVIVPANLSGNRGLGNDSIYLQNILSTVRRGTIVKIAAEFVMVWSVTSGPDGSISIETSTVSNHTAGQTLTVIPTIVGLLLPSIGAPPANQAFNDASITYQVTVGIGTQTTPLTPGVFLPPTQAYQPDDYISVGINVDVLANLSEMKLLFDVDDGSFTKNFYYYTVRPSDIAQAVANSATQLSIVQTVTQRAIIDKEIAIASGNQIQADSSAQLAPGSGQWTQIVFSISELTRVGGDQSKSLQTVVKFQVLWNASGTINVAQDATLVIFGSFQPDTGDVGAPYQYRVRPRSSITGACGNPSPATRYGITARREAPIVVLPSAAYDSQIDTWDVFRYGGAVTSWRFIGQTASSNATFLDNYSDAAAQAGDALDFDNFEPWPSIDIPTNGTASVVNGTTAVVSTTNTNILKYLPGTLVRLGGQNVYTLWTRPTSLGVPNYLLQFVENAGAGTNLAYQITEPIIANQHLPYLWGPDAAGTVFACGDPLRAGTVYFAKNYAPDSAPDAYNMEITPPTEPLVGGEVLDGLSFVASTERWWALYPQSNTPAQRYAPVQQPFPRGLAAPFGHCTDGVSIYWWAKDGIYSSSRGSLTDADLYNLFPHEGVVGETVTYPGSTLLPPDYSRAGFFRLTYANGYLYAVYQNTFGTYVNLVCHVATGAWCVDTYGDGTPVSVFHHPEQQAGTLSTSVLTPARYDELLMGDTLGRVTAQVDLANDVNVPIACVLGTREDDGGDARAPKQWGDLFLDATPAATGGIAVSLVSLGAVVTTLPAVPSAAVRTRQPLSVSSVGDIVTDFLGIRLTWTDNFLTQSTPTTLNLWQPSFVVQPAKDIEWFTFGTAFGMDGYHHLRQIALAYVSTAPITLTIASYDGLSPAPIIIPSSAGAYVKLLFPVGANKGLLHNFHAVSSAPFQIFLADSEFFVGAWGRAGAYLAAKSLGGRDVEPAIV